MTETRAWDGVVIWSGEYRAWWRKGEDGSGRGYTDNISSAGVWPRSQAERMTSHCGPGKQIRLDAAPCQSPAAPCADEVEVVARAIHNEAVRQHNAGEIDPTGAGPQMARVILAALSPLRQAERERAWREGAEAAAQLCDRQATWANGVGETESGNAKAWARAAESLAVSIRALSLPPMGGV